MHLWPVLLWPKPKAKQNTKHYGNRNINFQFNTRTFSVPATAPTIATTFLYIFAINALVLITTTLGLTVTQHPTGNYGEVNDVANVDVVSALTGLSNGYSSLNYLKNYYQVSEAEATKQQQQQQQQEQQQQQQQQQQQNNVNVAAVKSGYQIEMGAAGRGNSIVAQGGGGGGLYEDAFNVYNSGFVPTTFTAAGQHYAASLVGLQTATDKSNTLHQYATTAANKNNLNSKHQPYVNVNSNSNSNNNNIDFVAELDNNKAQHSLFRRLASYGGRNNGDGVTSGAHLDAADNEDGHDAATGTGTGGVMQNYALTYADDAQQSALLQNFYNQQTTFNDAQSGQEQTFANYFPPLGPATTEYEIENQQKYYTFNNYPQTTKPPQQQFEQQQYAQYKQKQQYQQQQPQQSYELQQQSFNKQEIPTATPTPAPVPAPATYFQNFIQHKNDNREHYQQHRHVAADNYHRWKHNQIMANYQPKQSAVEKQQEQYQKQQYYATNNQYQQHNQHHLLQEPETAATSHSLRTKKSPKSHKSKRQDNQDAYEYENNYNYENILEQNDNTIEHGSEDAAGVQLHQLEKLQEQLQQQQQQFIELQHQLIDHDQQLQIQKHVANTAVHTLPPITQTVHHNQQSLQALAGSPLSKHTQIIKTIPVPQHRQVYVPYRENVTIEIPDPVITPIKKPYAIKIPITNTVTVPNIQEVKIPIEKVRPFPVERPIPYIVERRVPYTVEKQVAQPVYYPVPIKVPIVHTVIHKIPKPPHSSHNRHQSSYHLPHTVYHKSHGHGLGHGHGHGLNHHGQSHYYFK